MKRLRVLVLMHPDFVPPDSTKGYSAQEINRLENRIRCREHLACGRP